MRESIKNYCKRDDYGYKDCKKDLSDFFKDKSINIIASHPILISPSNTCKFIKSRIENSNYNKGKSGGYRLYYYVALEQSHVYFLGFYPKIGKYGREDLTATELKLLIQTFTHEKNNASLIEHDINNEFSEIQAIQKGEN